MAVVIDETRAIEGFPFAPIDWTPDQGTAAAGLEPTEGHWDAVRALQEYFARHAEDRVINKRELHDALEERFHSQGGMKYLYRLFPGGPVAQGCQLAGLEPPPGSVDSGFGSVQ
ncbi:MAG: TusE/DsrC/DsvC family sulfur relay protein [Thiohalobacterales bacterium]|nr:TusE/DsrC/DsvC family sulfur relay protein [Thiohalobacterales bacterium]